MSARAAERDADPNDALLQQIREHFEYDLGQWQPIRDEGSTDMRHVAGDPWEPEDRRRREDAGRVCLSLDELAQYHNAVINDVRANPRGMKFAPIGQGANEKTAEFYQNKAREIEYRSRAAIVYTTAFQNAVERGYGFARVNKRYVSDNSFNQELWLEPFANPDSVIPDADSIMPDSSDMTRCFVIESRTQTEFLRGFPDAQIRDFTKELATLAPKWVKGDKVQLAEYWTYKAAGTKTLLSVQPPSIASTGAYVAPALPPLVEIFEDDWKVQGSLGEVKQKRKVEQKKVCQYLTNGVEILETHEWDGKYIPIVSCYGKVIYKDGERFILSMTRLARDPYMAYCFYRTCEMENVGMTTKNPYWAYEGQVTQGQANEIAKSMHEPVAVLFAKATTQATGATVLPLPMRNVSEPAIQALSVGAEEMRRAIQAAMGTSFLPTQAQRRNEKSGKALDKIDQTAQRGSFHFVDHYNDMIERVGILVEDLMDKTYDAARDTGVRKPNDEAEIVRINDPQYQPQPGRPQTSYPTTKGEHQVTVSAGPSFDSERDAASSFADLLLETPFAPRIGDLAVKLKNLGPIGDEIAERLTPPEFAKQKDGEQPTPEQLQQQVMQLQSQLQKVEGIAQQMKQAIDTDAAKQQATVEKAKIDAASAKELQQMKDATSIAVAHIAAASKGLALDAHAAEEAQALGHAAQMAGAQAEHEGRMTAAQHQQALQAAAQSHQQALAQGQQAHQQSLEAGDVAHQQNLEAGDQATAGQLAVQAAKPVPQNGAGA